MCGIMKILLVNIFFSSTAINNRRNIWLTSNLFAEFGGFLFLEKIIYILYIDLYNNIILLCNMFNGLTDICIICKTRRKVYIRRILQTNILSIVLNRWYCSRLMTKLNFNPRKIINHRLVSVVFYDYCGISSKIVL
jgi:hypothetical protein